MSIGRRAGHCGSLSRSGGAAPHGAQHRHDLLWLVPLDWHDPLFLQVDSLSFHLVQILPVTSLASIRGLPDFVPNSKNAVVLLDEFPKLRRRAPIGWLGERRRRV